MSAYDRITGPELVQSTYFIEGKGWRTHHVISRTASFEREATPEEIEEAKGSIQDSDPAPENVVRRKPGRPRKAE